jgi:putative ABC transport system ATP-binding protein
MDLIQDLNVRHQQTFVIVTHAPDVAARCHRIVHMKDGQIVREEVPAGAGAR